MKTTFLFAWFPYLSAALAVTGLIVRYARLNGKGELGAFDLQAFKDKMWYSSLILMLLAHLLGLLLPGRILVWNSSPVRLYALEIVLFLLGLILLAGCLAKIWRQLRNQGKGTAARLSDTIFLSLFFVEVLSGLTIALAYRWGSFWAVVTLTPYVRSLLQGSPQVSYVTEMPFLIALHTFCTYACLVILPLTRVAPALLGTLHRVLAVALAPVGEVLHAGIRGGEVWFRKHNPALWLWPEEED